MEKNGRKIGVALCEVAETGSSDHVNAVFKTALEKRYAVVGLRFQNAAVQAAPLLNKRIGFWSNDHERSLGIGCETITH